MKRKACALFLALSMLCSFLVVPVSADVSEAGSTQEAVYLGIKDFKNSEGSNKDSFEYLFSVDGITETYRVANVDGVYALQNQLMEGYIYNITVEDGTVTDVELLDRDSECVVMGTVDEVGDGTITVDGAKLLVPEGVKTFEITTAAGGASVEEAQAAKGDSVKVTVDDTRVKTIYKAFIAEEYEAPVSGIPGKKTLKNLLATALEPVGTALYIYGGTWDWQDANSSNQAMTIGIPQSWIDFFQSKDADYYYEDYEYRDYNEYYYGGPDCSGYMGWVLYNLMNTKSSTVSDSEGYVASAAKQAKNCADQGWGTMDMGDTSGSSRVYTGHDFKPGDIFSMNGHVWMCIGTCKDGSIVFVHSTPNTTGGAGAQISALGSDKSCEAYQLANYYMNQYYPAWSDRYGDQVLCLSFESYTTVSRSTAGKFSWDLDGEITDPDGYAKMTPAQILADLFGEETPKETTEAVYLGIKDFANSDGRNKDNFEYLFSVDGVTETYRVENVDGVYALQNQLMEGYVYDIVVEDGTVTDVTLLDKGSSRMVMGTVDDIGDGIITVDGRELTVAESVRTFEIVTAAGGASVEEAQAAKGDSVKVTVNGTAAGTIYKAFVAEEYEAPVSGTPGKKTLKNFLATALEPVGTSLYIYGGSWDWQDENSSNQAMTIGVPQSWIDFFQSHDADYTYRNDGDSAHSYYWRHYNEYYYGGPDCSGYVGWVLYNLMNTKSSTVSDSEGYVASATWQAKNCAAEGWGTMDMGDELLNEDGTPWLDEDGDGRRIYTGHDFKPGDIFSMNGHVWISLGTCSDGSVVFMHSTPNTTNGAGAQISALGPDKNCEAYQLANYYMNKYYPEWSERYGDQVLCLSFDSYTKVYGSTAGKFSWDLDGVVTDPDGYADMTPAQILADLFGEVNTQSAEAVYLGVSGYGTVTSKEKADFNQEFFLNGDIKTFKISSDNNYAIQNQLMEGYIYNITVENSVVTGVKLLDRGSEDVVMGTVDEIGDGTITVDGKKLTVAEGVKTFEISTAAGGASVKAASVAANDTVKVTVDGTAVKTIYKAFVAEEYEAPVNGIPGKKTLKNFLATALEPVGTGLYVYGGAWDWQDENSSNQAMTIGIPQSWIDFFQSQDENYSYKTSSDPAHSYYPHNSWNQYYYAGVDCSGYVGWVVYNVLNTKNATVADNTGYVGSSTKMAKRFSDLGWGTWTRSTENGFHVGDVFSMSGHVWICLGTCEDGSIVFMHSTPSDSKAGASGGGIQISALNPAETKDCEAYRLADHYMSTYYPRWSQRYDAILRSYDSYTAIASNANAGKFTWNLDGTGILTDPDGYADMTPAEILEDLFSSVTVRFESDGGSEVESQMISAGTVAVKPADPEKSGYAFRGWYEDEELKTAYDFSKPVAENLVLYAKWERKTTSGGSGSSISRHTITVETAVNGTVTSSHKNAGKGTTITLTVNPSKGYTLETLTVLDKDDNKVTLTEKSGKYTFTMPDSKVTVKASFMEDNSLQNFFADVSADAYYYDAVLWAAEQGITSGTTATTFTPGVICTRAQMVTFLWRAMGCPEPASNVNPFTDVAANAYYYKAVLWAVEKGITNGTTATTFAPDATVTRAQAVTFLWRTAGKPSADQVNPFADVAVDAYYSTAVLWAVAQNITNGTTADSFAPNSGCTRAQIVTFLYRYLES